MAEKKDSKPSSIIEEISASKKYKSKKARFAHAVFVIVMLAVMFGVIAGITYRITSKVGHYIDEKDADDSKSHVTISGPTDPEEDPKPVPDKVINVSELAEKVKPAVVTVQIQIEKNDGIFSDKVKTYKNVAGIIVAKDDHNFYILAVCDKIDEEAQITVNSGKINLSGRSEGHLDSVGIDIITANYDELDSKDVEAFKVLSFANESPKSGAPVMAIGSPNGAIGSVDAGIVTSVGTVRNYSDKSFELMTSNMTSYKKGSGFVVDDRGDICGLITKDKELTDVFCFINLATEIELIEQFVNNGVLPHVGMICEELSQVDQVTGKDITGVYIASVNANSAADKAGIRNGDILLSVDGETVDSPLTYKEMLLSHKAGQTIECVILRNGEEKTYKIKVE